MRVSRLAKFGSVDSENDSIKKQVKHCINHMWIFCILRIRMYDNVVKKVFFY